MANGDGLCAVTQCTMPVLLREQVFTHRQQRIDLTDKVTRSFLHLMSHPPCSQCFLHASPITHQFCVIVPAAGKYEIIIARFQAFSRMSVIFVGLLELL